MKKIKNVIILILIIMCGVCIAGNTVDAASKKTVIKKYKQLLSKSTIKWDEYDVAKTSDLKFSLVYIDNDKIPELIVYNPNSNHAAGWYRLYYYYKGKLKMQYLQDGTFYYKKTGVIARKYIGMGAVSCEYYKLSKGKFKNIVNSLDERQSGMDVDGDGRVTITYTNSKYNTISSKSFKSVLKKNTKRKSKTKPKYHKNTKANRKKYLQ